MGSSLPYPSLHLSLHKTPTCNLLLQGRRYLVIYQGIDRRAWIASSFFHSKAAKTSKLLSLPKASEEKTSEQSLSNTEESKCSDNSHINSQAAHVPESEASSLIPWTSFPPRFKLILAASAAFVICNMDKVNLSVAIIPMSHQLGWNASTAGLVQSSFFWGYALSQLPGGWFAKRFTGKTVLRYGVLLWSLATAIAPLVASSLPSLLFCRLMVGLGEGVSPAAATDLIARSVPATERSRAVTFVFSGLSMGSIIGLLLAPRCIEAFGWESVFYFFGLLGVFWCIVFRFASEENESAKVENQRNIRLFGSRKITINEISQKKHLLSLDDDSNGGVIIPWKSFFRSPAVWSMVYAHFCGNWGHYSVLAWLPTYFSEELHLDVTNAALVSILPPSASIVVSSIAAPLADHLISAGVEITTVRKLCQTIAFMAPAICMTVASTEAGLSPWMTVWILTSGLALSSFALAGLYCTHQDISPKYASILLGITNTAGALPGIFGVYLTGYILDQTHSWNLALFAPSVFFYVTGSVVWLFLASSEPQNFD